MDIRAIVERASEKGGKVFNGSEFSSLTDRIKETFYVSDKWDFKPCFDVNVLSPIPGKDENDIAHAMRSFIVGFNGTVIVCFFENRVALEINLGDFLSMINNSWDYGAELWVTAENMIWHFEVNHEDIIRFARVKS